MSIADAIRELIAAHTEYELARNEYDGGSWGYHGHGYIMRVDAAEKSLNEAIDALVKARVAQAIGEKP